MLWKMSPMVAAMLVGVLLLLMSGCENLVGADVADSRQYHVRCTDGGYEVWTGVGRLSGFPDGAIHRKNKPDVYCRRCACLALPLGGAP